MSELDEAIREANAAAALPSGASVARLLEGIGLRASASAVFGTPVSQHGVTVIPVARVKWAGGGGNGTSATDGGQSGEGGGGGAIASPAGFIEVDEKGARFVVIREPGTTWPVILAAGVAAWLVLRGLRRLFR